MGMLQRLADTPDQQYLLRSGSEHFISKLLLLPKAELPEGLEPNCELGVLYFEKSASMVIAAHAITEVNCLLLE
jgi:hypothetical protein